MRLMSVFLIIFQTPNGIRLNNFDRFGENHGLHEILENSARLFRNTVLN